MLDTRNTERQQKKTAIIRIYDIVAASSQPYGAKRLINGPTLYATDTVLITARRRPIPRQQRSNPP